MKPFSAEAEDVRKEDIVIKQKKKQCVGVCSYWWSWSWRHWRSHCPEMGCPSSGRPSVPPPPPPLRCRCGSPSPPRSRSGCWRWSWRSGCGREGSLQGGKMPFFIVIIKPSLNFSWLCISLITQLTICDLISIPFSSSSLGLHLSPIRLRICLLTFHSPIIPFI